MPALPLTVSAMGLAEQLDWLDQHHHAVDALLSQQVFIPLYPQLVEACGSLKGALLLGQGIALSRNWLRKDQSRNGWFWLTAADWQSATGLTLREQESARQNLVDAGLWQERRTHNPSRLYHRVLLPAVAAALGVRLKSVQPEIAQGYDDAWSWNETVADRILGRAPIVYFKALADLAGGVMAGLLLTRLLEEQRLALRQGQLGSDGRFEAKFDQIAAAIGMGMKAARNARDQLRRAGFILDETRGSGPKAGVWVSVNLPAMLACLQAQPMPAQRTRVSAAYRAPAERHPSRPTAELSLGGTQPSSPKPAGQQLDFLELPSFTDQALAHDSFEVQSIGVPGVDALLSIANRPVDKVDALLSIADESRCPFVDRVDALLLSAYTETELNTTPTPKASSIPSVDNSDPGRRRLPDEDTSPERQGADPSMPELSGAEEALIVPTGVAREAALKVVRPVPAAERQLVLDELAGQMAVKRKTIDSPLGYLHMLARKAQQGEFVATVAIEVAAARRAKEAAQRREAEAVQAKVPSTVQGPQHESAAVMPSAEVRARLQAAKASLGRSMVSSPSQHAQEASDEQR